MMAARDPIRFITPANGECFGQVEPSTIDDVERARAELRETAPRWAATPVRERVRVLRQLQRLMIDEADDVTEWITRDTGKSRQDALTELFTTMNLVSQYLTSAPRWLRRRRVSPGIQLFKRCYTLQRPHGVVAVIAPWNYPLILTVGPVFAALLAGNAVLAKPSEVAAGCGVMIESFFARIPELAPYIRFLHGGPEVGADMVKARPDLVYVTGSVGTGIAISRAAAENLTPVICELGGKDPMIVLDDADVVAAARWGCWGAFYNAGQTCISVERVYVEEGAYDAFVRAAVAKAKGLEQGYSLDTESHHDLGPIAYPRQMELVEAHLADALAKGARVLTGGRRRDMFFEPTVLVDVDHSMELMREESFGPFMPIMRVRDEEEALRLANDSEMGLSASVWSEDPARARRVAERLEVGSVNINDTMSHYAIPLLPFGGTKQSGAGRFNGEEGLRTFTQTASFVSGKPRPYDIGTIMREPGNYRLARALLLLTVGASWRQRLRGLRELLGRRRAGRADG